MHSVSKAVGDLVDWGRDKATRQVQEGMGMKTGIIRRRGRKEIIGTWRADQHSLVVETEDAELRRAADEILGTPQSIPVHASERHAGLSYSEDVVETPAKLKYLALFALEMEERGFEVEPDEEEEWEDDDEFDDDDEDEDEEVDDDEDEDD
jgi:hypothetical protein